MHCGGDKGDFSFSFLRDLGDWLDLWGKGPAIAALDVPLEFRPRVMTKIWAVKFPVANV